MVDDLRSSAHSTKNGRVFAMVSAAKSTRHLARVAIDVAHAG